MKAFFIFTIVFILSIHSVTAQEQTASAEAVEKLLEPTETDIIIGNKEAPITIIEYASLSCIHCAQFHNDTLPTLQEKYIDSGKLKLIFRHFPLNAPALKAAMVVQCVEDNDKRAKFVKTLFKTIERWAYSNDFEEKLQNIAKIGGMSGEDFTACINNKALETNILNAQVITGKQLTIKSTPSLFLNKTLVEDRSIEGLTSAIDPLVQ